MGRLDLPEQGAVHLWEVDLDRPVKGELLSVDEKEKAARFKFERDRARYVAGRQSLREILGSYLDRELVFEYGPAGKPSLSGIAFNLAHSGNRALIGVARDGLIGVDLEEVRSFEDMADVARHAFTPDELKFWKGDARTFYRLWTCKEAYLKGIGEGIAHWLQWVTVGFDEEDRPFLKDGAEGNWTLREWDVGEGFAAAVAWDHPFAEIMARRWPI